MSRDQIQIGTATERETGAQVVTIRNYIDGTMVFGSAFPPALARTMAQELLDSADLCDAAVAGAAAVATAAIRSAKEG